MPAVVGVPVTVPVVALIANPVGRPVADHEAMVATEELSLTGRVRLAMAAPVAEDFAPGLVTDTAFVTVQVKVALPNAVVVSVAVSVTEQAHAVVGMPEMVPVAELMTSPAGKPVADQVRVWPAAESVADETSPTTAAPEMDDWAPGFATTITSEIVQVNEADPAALVVSVAVTTAVDDPADVGEPDTIPVEGSMDRPEGRPVADHVNV